MHEASMHMFNSFVTLTYDDDHLPEYNSLNYKHFQDFMKRLRKSHNGVRFICAVSMVKIFRVLIIMLFCLIVFFPTEKSIPPEIRDQLFAKSYSYCEQGRHFWIFSSLPKYHNPVKLSLLKANS